MALSNPQQAGHSGQAISMILIGNLGVYTEILGLLERKEDKKDEELDTNS